MLDCAPAKSTYMTCTVHILSGDLIMLKRTLDPIKTMVYNLRKYDLDRCIALHDNLALARREQEERDEKREKAKKRKKGKHSHEEGDVKTSHVSTGLHPRTAPSFSSHESDYDRPMTTRRNDDQHLRAMLNQHPHCNGWFSYKSKVYLVSSFLQRRYCSTG